MEFVEFTTITAFFSVLRAAIITIVYLDEILLNNFRISHPGDNIIK